MLGSVETLAEPDSNYGAPSFIVAKQRVTLRALPVGFGLYASRRITPPVFANLPLPLDPKASKLNGGSDLVEFIISIYDVPRYGDPDFSGER